MQPFITQEEAAEIADELFLQVEAECADLYASFAPFVLNQQQYTGTEVF